MSNLAIVTNNPGSDDVSEARELMRSNIAEIAELNSERERLTALAAQAGEEEAAKLAVDRAETELFRAWAASGAKGEAPALLTAERKTASARLAIAQAVAAGAETAIGEIDAKLAAAHFEAHEIGARIDDAIFSEMLARYAATFADCERNFAAARANAATCYGLRQAVYARAHELASEGKEGQSLQFLQRLERIKMPDTDFLGAPTNAEVSAAHALATNEIRRLGELGK